MSSDVSTSLGAQVALQSLFQTQRQLSQISNRLNTNTLGARTTTGGSVSSAAGQASRGDTVSFSFDSGASGGSGWSTQEAGMVDADLSMESARLQAMQTKQQLGAQALSIANQRPQSLMKLFA